MLSDKTDSEPFFLFEKAYRLSEKGIYYFVHACKNRVTECVSATVLCFAGTKLFCGNSRKCSCFAGKNMANLYKLKPAQFPFFREDMKHERSIQMAEQDQDLPGSQSRGILLGSVRRGQFSLYHACVFPDPDLVQGACHRCLKTFLFCLALC